LDSSPVTNIGAERKRCKDLCEDDLLWNTVMESRTPDPSAKAIRHLDDGGGARTMYSFQLAFQVCLQFFALFNHRM
jgi:hypothetical protein